MEITINGADEALDSEVSLTALLAAKGVSPETVVIELNAEIIPAADYDVTMVADGDRIEILRFVGGG